MTTDRRRALPPLKEWGHWEINKPKDALLEALSDEDGLVRRAALRSLRQLGCAPSRTVPVARAREDPDLFVGEEARFWQGDEG